MTALLAGACVLGISLPAQSQVSLSGHVAYNMLDRDSEDDIVFQRNGYSESRFKLAYEHVLENEMTLEVVQEIGIGEAEGALDSRRQEVILNFKEGAIRFGQGNDAGDDNMNGDLSGTTVVQPMASLADVYGYPGANYNGFDPGRGERIRYDSPRFGDSGVASVQLGEDDEIEIGLRYNTELAGGQFRLGAFLTNTDSDTDQDSSGVLVAFALENGINFAVAFSSRDNTAGTSDGDFESFKVGFKTGKHAFSLLLGTSEDPGNAVETDATGIAYVFMLAAGIEFYAASQEFDADVNAADEDFLLVGTRVKF